MAYHFDFDSGNRILRCTFADRVSDEDLTKFYRSAAEWVASLDPRAGIADLTSVTSFEVTPQTIRALAKSAPAMPQASRPRIIVAGSAHIFGMARMFELEGEVSRPNLHVVRTLKEAWAILGVQDAQFDPIPELLDPSNTNSGFRPTLDE